MPNQIVFEECRPVREHARLVMRWRNDPITLEMFYHRSPKEWDSFWSEFLDTYFTDVICPLFVTFGGNRVGFLKFSEVHDAACGEGLCVDISINIAPEYRGKGIGALTLLSLCDYLEERGVKSILSEVRVQNVASQRAFSTAGYVCLGETVKYIHDTGEMARIVRFLRKLGEPMQQRRPVFIIAEAGSNFRMGTPPRDLAMAKALIDVAAEAGADAVKFQTYRPETVYVPNAGEADYLSEAGVKESITDIFRDLSMPYDMIPKLAKYCEACGIEFMSTPFSVADAEAVDPFVARHKLASYEISHRRLIERLAATGKPLIMSTGAAEEADIEWAVDLFLQSGGKDLTLLQCTAKYPAPLSSLNLRAIPWLRERFGVSAGLSDHSRDPIIGPAGGVALGATVVEKHFTLHNKLPGPDHSFALTPDDLKTMVRAIRDMEQAVSQEGKTILADEQELRSFARRSVQAVRAIKKGEPIREGVNVDILRPGKQRQGAHPRLLDDMEGKPATRDIPAGDGVEPGDWTDA